MTPGELAFLVGPSGAGKTTLLKLINRELRPTSGQIWVDGIAAHDLRASRVSQLRRHVGVVFQDFKLLPRLTAKENVALALQVGDLRISDGEASERAMDALEAVGLGIAAGRFRTSSRAVSSSASPSPARWSDSLACSSQTSRRATSTWKPPGR